MKNLIFIVSIGRDNYLQYCLPSVKFYCKKYNIDLKVISNPLYNIPSSLEYNYKTFEKNQVYNYIEGYDRILRLDSDIIINPNAPNFFESDSNYIYVTYEDVGPRKVERKFEIERLKKSLGHIKNWNEGYFNSGVILFSQMHKEIFNFNLEDLGKDLGPYKEQSYLNWKVKSLGFELVNLGKDFNHLQAFEEDWSNSNRLNASIIHYAGPQHSKEKKMSEDFKYFYPNLSENFGVKTKFIKRELKKLNVFMILKKIFRKIFRTQVQNIPSIRRDNIHRRKSFIIEIKNLLSKNIVSLEIGVAAGDFSAQIIDSLSIKEHHLVDPWTNSGDELRSQWFNENNPAEASFHFVKERFQNKPVKIFRDFSHNYLLNKIFNKKMEYDFIYIDGDHHSEAVYLDLVLGWHILKYDGIMSGDDYNWVSRITKRKEVEIGVKKFERSYGVKASIIRGDNNGLDQFYFIKNRNSNEPK